METIKLSIAEHDGGERLFADFPYNKELLQIIKEVPGARWSMSKKKWHFNMNKQVVELLKEKIHSKATLDLSLLSQQWKEMEERIGKQPYPDSHKPAPYLKTGKIGELNDEAKKKIEKYKLWLRSRRYSESTVKTYSEALQSFLKYYTVKPITEITNDDVY